MKKQIAFFTALLLLGGTLMTACNKTVPTEESSKIESVESDPVPEKDNVLLNATYAYDCGYVVKGDVNGDVLTDGNPETVAVIKPSDTRKSLVFHDWYGKEHTEMLDNSVISFSVDFGFMTAVENVQIDFVKYEKKPIKIFASTDGYNFTFYLGEFNQYAGNTFKAVLNNVNVKALMFVIPVNGEEISVSGVSAKGQTAAEKKLLSLGAAYEWPGAGLKKYPDDGKKLTDGIKFNGDIQATLVGKSGTRRDPVTHRAGNVVKLDLKEIKNISEVDFGVYSDKPDSQKPGRITVRYSEDDKEYFDFGQSQLKSGTSDVGCSSRYTVTRNHTVKARYVMIYTYFSPILCIDEISVYGSDSEVKEPDYEYVNRINSFSNSDIAAHRPAFINDNKKSALTDMIFTQSSKISAEDKIKIDLQKKHDDIVAVSVCTDKKPNGIKAFADGKEIKGKFSVNEVTGNFNYYICYFMFDEKVSAQNAELQIDSDGITGVREVMVYAGRAHLPYVNGGFFQLPTDGAGNPSSHNSDYSWYLHLKGMKDLGMETVIIQYSTHFLAKTTLINGKNLIAAGYKYNDNYDSPDVCKAVLDAAEKLNMKVFIGTIHDSNFTDPSDKEKTANYKQIVEDSHAAIQDIHDMYSDRKSFGGYYLSDETCDAWLHMRNGPEAARYIYKGQSDYIRKIDPDAKIMIAPAIWRSGNPKKSGELLYKMIAPENPGEKPIVDILAAQDCLGREGTLKVTDSAYKDYMSHVEQWALATRRAGTEFWHDAEVFEIISTQKRTEDLKKSFALETMLSGQIVVFDIPHYFSPLPMGAYNDDYDYYKRLITRDYIEYFSYIRDEANKFPDAKVPDALNKE